MFAAYFSATRAFAVLGLFGNALSFAWMLGYTLEKLMDYDPCTVASLVALMFSSGEDKANSLQMCISSTFSFKYKCFGTRLGCMPINQKLMYKTTLAL